MKYMTVLLILFLSQNGFTYQLSETDMSESGKYTVTNLKDMYGKKQINKSDKVMFTFILNRRTDINHTNFLPIRQVLEMSYSKQQQYIRDHKKLIPVWYGASEKDMDQVKQYFQKSGFSIIRINREQRTITSTVENFTKTFLDHCDSPLIFTSFYYCNNSDSSLSVSDQKVSELIMGLVHFQQSTIKHYRLVPNEKVGISSSKKNKYQIEPEIKVLYPTEIARMYNFPKNAGAGNKIGIIAQAPLDHLNEKINSLVFNQYVRIQYKNNNNARYNVHEQIAQMGSFKAPSEEIELYLDISILASIVPRAKIVILGRDKLIPTLYSQYALGIYTGNFNIISSSFVATNNYYQKNIYKAIFQDAIFRDITLVVAAGDRGSLNAYHGFQISGKPINNATTGASGVLSVGGTSFSKKVTDSISDNRKWSVMLKSHRFPPPIHDLLIIDENNQTTWNTGCRKIKTYVGRGVKIKFPSIYANKLTVNQSSTVCFLLDNHTTSSGQFDKEIYPMPSYQRENLPHIGGRSYPDVSFLAGENQQGGQIVYLIPYHNKIAYAIGTSASAPLMAALVALTNTSLKAKYNKFDGSIGFINPLLYSAYKQQANFFIDVPKGSHNANIFTFVEPGQLHKWDNQYLLGKFIKQELLIAPIMPGESFLYETTQGYDIATGLGSINGKAFYQYIDKNNLWK